jgi:hypothetical protein
MTAAVLAIGTRHAAGAPAAVHRHSSNGATSSCSAQLEQLALGWAGLYLSLRL